MQTNETVLNVRNYFMDLQTRICAALEASDGAASFSLEQIESPNGGLSQPRVIADGDVHYSHPQWHPSDPDRILVVVNHRNLAVFRVGSGRMEPLTDFDRPTITVDYASWSPDGEKVYFSLARKTGDIYLIEND